MKNIINFCLILFPLFAKTQSNNMNVSFATFQTKIQKAGHTPSLFNQQSISTSIKIYRNIHVDISLLKWNSKNIGLAYPNYISYGYPKDTTMLANWKFRQKNYKFLDLLAVYKLSFYDKMNLSVGAGLSYAFGTDNIIYKYYINPSPPNDLLIWVRDSKNKQLGLVMKLNPSYTFLKKRVDIGFILQYRYYPNTLFQRELGITLGYNFLKTKM